ncbi:MAG: hypothetical protein KJO01_12025 [Gammaproteobacteria bacterium]|nr:hypothetical protein [Gammaproteobacteria bacterium]MBT8111008.1 hypothetical protein [Gammaproteobacteria bacterium]NND48444.1 hypothetical protein [Woeseiaceae bacterium]NNL45706.1 hypothetical protein [Woeseiaceae bacterium]
MNGKNDDIDDDLDDDSSDDTLTSTVILSDDDDDDDDDVGGDTTIQMDIDRLVAKLDASDSDDVHRRAEIRRRLEDLREQRQQELDSTFNFNLDDDDD